MALAYIVDTNSIGEILGGNNKSLLLKLSSAKAVYLSIISVIEFLANPAITLNDGALFDVFCGRCIILDLVYTDVSLLNKVVSIRKKYRTKLPDAVIAAQVIENGFILISNDSGFNPIYGLKQQSF